ncbi:MAG: hypothetical protein KAT68_03340 [Bacteroidales bacterium]|nr:hypothetical protein [Bacteroidales bacterium]
MKSIIKYFLFLLFFHVFYLGYSQTEDDYMNLLLEDDEEEELIYSSFKPVLGFGQGLFTYFGDVNDYYSHPYSGRFATKLSVSRNLSQYIDFNLFIIFGKLTGNQRDLSGLDIATTNFNNNLNFETDIFIGGVNLSYNFKHLTLRDRPVAPFISIGVETFEFSSKADLFDKYGNEYYYWNDGTIRNMAESSNNISNSIIIQRDYKYETDIREYYEKDYSQFVFSIPVDIGLDITVTNRLTMRLGNTFHFTSSDFIDNIDKKNGFLKNDAFLHSYISFELDLFSPVEEIMVVEQFKNLKFAITDKMDEDNDGVDDFNDECPYTPEKVLVSFTGCPLDDDKDGIPNYLDTQEGTPIDAIAVGENGIRIINTYLIAMLYEPDAITRKEIYSYYESMGKKDISKKGYSGIPAKFKSVDVDNDGYISADELQKAVDNFFDFNSNLTLQEVNELREFFFDQ